jgi:hypothetical protein
VPGPQRWSRGPTHQRAASRRSLPTPADHHACHISLPTVTTAAPLTIMITVARPSTPVFGHPRQVKPTVDPVCQCDRCVSPRTAAGL